MGFVGDEVQMAAQLCRLPRVRRCDAAAAQLQTLVREQWKFVGDEVQMAAQLCGLPRVQLAPASAPLTSMSTTMSTMSTRMSTASGSETKDRRSEIRLYCS